MSALWWLIACSPAPTPPAAPPRAPVVEAPPAPGVWLAPLSTPAGDATKRAQVAPKVTVNGKDWPLSVQTLLVEGEVYDGPPFGALVDQQGKPIRLDGALRSCKSADFNALFSVAGAPVLLTHLECRPGALQFTRLQLDGSTAAVKWSRPADLSAIGGISNPCAGDLTAWGTLLSGEEYEPDARRIGPDGKIPGDRFAWHRQGDWTGNPAKLDPYAFGWMVESRPINADGRVEAVKHPAMGRFSHELGLVLPDRRTVYLSDDGNDGAQFLFIADQAGDLSAGLLYAARWAHAGDPTAPAPIQWVPLGHSTDAAIQAHIGGKKTRFAQLFDAADPVDDACPPGLQRVQSMMGDECLVVRPGQAELASRLESRRVAALLGATTELRKAEGLAYDTKRQRVYLAISEIGAGMLPEPHRVPDHLAFEANPCGAIFAFDQLSAGVTDTAGAPMPSALIATQVQAVLLGRPEGEGCHPDGIANADNLRYLPEADWLLIAEDTHRHKNAVLWAWTPGDAPPARLLTAPTGGEISGMSWTPDLDGVGWMPFSVQYPPGPPPGPAGRPPEAPEDRTWVGLIGPFPGPGAWAAP